jgi:hypothetical protein
VKRKPKIIRTALFAILDFYDVAERMRFELMHGFWPSNGLANRPLNQLEYLSKRAVFAGFGFIILPYFMKLSTWCEAVVLFAKIAASPAAQRRKSALAQWTLARRRRMSRGEEGGMPTQTAVQRGKYRYYAKKAARVRLFRAPPTIYFNRHSTVSIL